MAAVRSPSTFRGSQSWLKRNRGYDWHVAFLEQQLEQFGVDLGDFACVAAVDDFFASPLVNCDEFGFAFSLENCSV